MPKEEDEMRGSYQSVLNNRHLLLLLDNARDSEQVKPLLPPPNCAVIVTSRQDISLPGMRTIRLDEMKPDESIDLLKRIVEAKRRIKEVSDDCWKEIASLCGHLPLALRLAGTFLANSRDQNPEDYAGSLRDERSRLEHIDKGSKRSGEISVQASLLLSYSRLPAEAARVFRLLSVFPLDFDSGAEEAVCQDKDHEQLSELLRWSLVDYQEESKRYRLHDLVRIFAYGKLLEVDGEDARDEARQRHSERYRDVLSFATEIYKNRNALAGLNIFDLERMNIESAWAWAKENLAKSNAAATICSSFLNWPYLLELRQHPRERILWMETALSAARRLNDRSMEGVHLGNLGNAYAALGDARRAIDYYEQALIIAREIGDRKNEGAWLGNLGNAYADLGDARKAIEYHEQALAIDREIGDRRGEGANLGNLGLAYADLGDARRAIDYYEQALIIAREIGDRKNEGAWLGNLGNAYAALGDAHKAIEYHEQALAIDREIGDRRGEGADLGNLGNAYAALGDAHKAIEYHEQALAIDREIGDRRGEGADLGNLGNAYASLGDAHKAIEYYEQRLVIAREIGDRRGEALTSWNLGLAYVNAEDLKLAAEVMQVCVDYEREIGHPDAENDAKRLQSIWDKLKS
jgi:tetratricopeptide (TPR) repeat protein